MEKMFFTPLKNGRLYQLDPEKEMVAGQYNDENSFLDESDQMKKIVLDPSTMKLTTNNLTPMPPLKPPPYSGYADPTITSSSTIFHGLDDN